MKLIVIGASHGVPELNRYCSSYALDIGDVFEF